MPDQGDLISDSTTHAPAAPVDAGQHPAAGQQPAAAAPDGAGTKPAGDLVSRSELEKAIAKRQAALDRARELEEKWTQAQEALKAVPPKEQLEAYQAWAADRAQQERDAAIKKGDVEAIERGVREPLQAQIQAKDATIDSLRGQLTELLCTSALKDAAVKAGAVNPDQVVGLLRHRVQMEQQPTGRFVPTFRDVQGQAQYDGTGQRVQDADTFVRFYLGQPENANLVRSTTLPGSGARPPGGPTNPPGERLPTSLEEFHALPEGQRLEVAAKMDAQTKARFLNLPTAQTDAGDLIS